MYDRGGIIRKTRPTTSTTTQTTRKQSGENHYRDSDTDRFSKASYKFTPYWSFDVYAPSTIIICARAYHSRSRSDHPEEPSNGPGHQSLARYRQLLTNAVEGFDFFLKNVVYSGDGEILSTRILR